MTKPKRVDGYDWRMHSSLEMRYRALKSWPSARVEKELKGLYVYRGWLVEDYWGVTSSNDTGHVCEGSLATVGQLAALDAALARIEAIARGEPPVPGAWARSYARMWLSRIFSRRQMEHIWDQHVTQLEHEWVEAIAEGNRIAAWVGLARNYVRIAKAMGLTSLLRWLVALTG